nr:hypothetical protein [Tanacetum cinerariifolium]
MSDSEHSLVTYTSVPSPVEDYLDTGSPEVDGPPSPDYVPGLEEPEQAPPLPVYLPYVLELVYPEYMPPEDDVFPAEEQPLPVAAIPITDSPEYILEFDPKRDLEEDDEEDPEEDPVDYPANSTIVALPPVDHVISKEVTEPLPQIPSPPLSIPSPPPNIPTHIEIPESCLPLQKRLLFASLTPRQEVGESSAAGAARQDEPAVARNDPYSLVMEELYGFVDRVDVAPGRLMSKELDYGITDTWDELVGASEEIAPTTLQGVNKRVIDLSTMVEKETTIMYGIMEDAQDDQSQLRGQVNLLYRDRPVHRRLAVMIEREARMAREVWGLSMDASNNSHLYVMSLLRNENDKGNIKFIEEDLIEPILTMPNPSLINSDSPTISHFLKDSTVHIPYINVNTFVDNVLLNHVGDKELKSSDGVRNGRMTKKEKDENVMPKEPNKNES